MKKKMVLALMCATMCLVSACGQKETAKMKADSVKEAADEAVAEEVVDGFEEGVGVAEDAEEPEPEKAEEAETVEEAEGPDLSDENIAKMLEENPYGIVDENAFPMVTWEAQSQNKSKDYGVWSLSCYDVDQFLDEEGGTPWQNNYDAKEYGEFSGRFSFPAITACPMFEGLIASSVTDDTMWLNGFFGDNREKSLSVIIQPGYLLYDVYTEQIGYSSDLNSFEGWYTAETDMGPSDVIKHSMTVSFGEDEDNLEEQVSNTYIYRLGNFTVSVNTGDAELTQDEMNEVITHLTYVGEPDANTDEPENIETDELTVGPEDEEVSE